MAEKGKWTDKEVGKLMDLWAEETIQFSLDNAETLKAKTSVCKTLQMQLQQQGQVRNLVLYDIHGSV